MFSQIHSNAAPAMRSGAGDACAAVRELWCLSANAGSMQQNFIVGKSRAHRVQGIF
jgi:hypothetical protein